MGAISAGNHGHKTIDVAALESLLRANVENLQHGNPEVIRATIQRHVPYIIAEPDGSFTVAVGYVLGEKNKYPPA